MSTHKLIPTMLLVLTTALATACDPSAAVLDSIGRPTSLCNEPAVGRCPTPTNP